MQMTFVFIIYYHTQLSVLVNSRQDGDGLCFDITAPFEGIPSFVDGLLLTKSP